MPELDVGLLSITMTNPDDIRARIQVLHLEIKAALDLPGILMITPIVLQKHAQIVDLTAQLAEISSQRLERQTDELIKQTDRLVGETLILRRFTKGVYWLTVVICFLTFVLIVIAYLEYSTKTH